MRIGILTYHCVPNFGAQLQVTSTVGFLKRMGHEPIVLNWYPQDLEDMYSLRIPVAQINCHNNYTREMLPVSRLCRTIQDLACVVDENKIDAVIVGGDALFKYVPERNRKRFSKRKLRYVYRDVMSVDCIEGNPFWGGFVGLLKKKIPIAAFSVSSQNCMYQQMKTYEKEKMREFLDSYSLINVRDEWTKSMVESITRRTNIKITPDPVFAFNQNYDHQLPSKTEIITKFHLCEKYVLICFSSWYVNADYINSIAEEVETCGLSPVALPMPEGLNASNIRNKIQLPLDPIDWYALIKYSSGYIGERMHPIVVCLHNVVPFFSFDEYGIHRKSLFGLRKNYLKESSKTYHILEIAGLSDNLFSYHSQNVLPSPKIVVEKLYKFPIEHCGVFSCSFQSLYEKEMSHLLKVLNCNR